MEFDYLLHIEGLFVEEYSSLNSIYNIQDAFL